MIGLYLLGCVAGAILPLQTSVNTGLRKATGSIYIASLISFSISALTFFVILLVTGQLQIPFARLFEEPPWIWLGGVFGIIYLMECILLFSCTEDWCRYRCCTCPGRLHMQRSGNGSFRCAWRTEKSAQPDKRNQCPRHGCRNCSFPVDVKLRFIDIKIFLL